MLLRVPASITIRLAAAALALGACGKAEPTPVAEVVTQAALDSLPRVAVTDGRRLCEADGRVACPLHSAVANWLGDDRFALWEPGRPIMIWNGTDSVSVELGATDGDTHGPVLALAVASDGSGYQMLVTGVRDRKLEFNSAGKVTDSTTLPLIPGTFSRGFSDETPLLLRMRGATGDNLVHYRLDILKSTNDTSGRPVINMPLSWLQMGADGRPQPAPFFPIWPSFGIDRTGGVAWSPGDRFIVHRLDGSGNERWTLNGDFQGPEVTSDDLAARRAQALAPDAPERLTPQQVDSMAAETGKYLPAISGVLVSRKGVILVTGAVSPARDSIVCYRISGEGKLLDQFRLPRRTRALLFAGDSVLVHQPTEAEPWEVRWLQLKPAH